MSESLAGVLFVTSLAVALAVVHRPLGDLLYWIATSPRDLAPERFAYRLVGADPKTEQSWTVYARSVSGVLGGVNPVSLRFSSAAKPPFRSA